MGVAHRSGHEAFGFVAGEAEHHALVAGTLLALIQTLAVHPLGDIRALAVDHVDHRHAFVIQPVVGVGVADILYHFPGHRLDIDVGRRGDLAADEHHPGGGIGFAGHVAGRIVGQAGVEHRVGHLVRQLVRMPLGHRFRCENVFLILYM
jgi:hypothetical protein